MSPLFKNTGSRSGNVQAIVIVVLAIVCILCIGFAVYLFYNPPSDFQIIYLGPQETKPILVLRDLSDAYPLYASELQVQIDLAAEGLDEALSVEQNSTVKPVIEKLHEDLDQLNADAKSTIIGAYTAYVTGLSVAESAEEREKVAQRYAKMLETIAEMITKVRSIREQIAAGKVATSSDQWTLTEERLGALREVIDELKNTDAAESDTDEEQPMPSEASPAVST